MQSPIYWTLKLPLDTKKKFFVAKDRLLIYSIDKFPSNHIKYITSSGKEKEIHIKALASKKQEVESIHISTDESKILILLSHLKYWIYEFNGTKVGARKVTGKEISNQDWVVQYI